MSNVEKVDLSEKLGLITEHWRPKVVGELNGQEVKLVKFQGPFVWHHHDNEDEPMFLSSSRPPHATQAMSSIPTSRLPSASVYERISGAR